MALFGGGLTVSTHRKHVSIVLLAQFNRCTSRWQNKISETIVRTTLYLFMYIILTYEHPPEHALPTERNGYTVMRERERERERERGHTL